MPNMGDEPAHPRSDRNRGICDVRKKRNWIEQDAECA